MPEASSAPNVAHENARAHLDTVGAQAGSLHYVSSANVLSLSPPSGYLLN